MKVRAVQEGSNEAVELLGAIRCWGHAVAQLIEALRYKLEGRGFDSRRSHWKFSVT